MPGRMLKEVAIYAALLLCIAPVMHPDLLSLPSERFARLREQGNYLHPLLYTGLFYVVLLLLRAIAAVIFRLFRRSTGNG